MHLWIPPQAEPILVSPLFHNYGSFDSLYSQDRFAATLSSMTRFARSPFLALAIVIAIGGCSSGPLKWNQSTPAAVVDNDALPKPRESKYSVLIVPSGAIKTRYISDKTSTAAGVIGTMVVGPIAGAVGGLVGSTASSTAASSAEEKASAHLDSSDVVEALRPVQLPQYFASSLADKLGQCGIRTTIYPTLLNPDNPDWSTTHLVLPPGFIDDAAPNRFFIEAGMVGIQIRDSLTDTTMEGNAYARVYETRSRRQIGRYSDKTGSSGSVTLKAYGKGNDTATVEMQQASKQVARYLASGIAKDMCDIMRRY